MAFGFGSLAGLAGIPKGYMDTELAYADIEDKRNDRLAQQLQGGALQSLQESGALSGAGGGAQQPPSAVQPPPPPAQPQQLQRGPPPIGNQGVGGYAGELTPGPPREPPGGVPPRPIPQGPSPGYQPPGRPQPAAGAPSGQQPPSQGYSIMPQQGQPQGQGEITGQPIGPRQTGLTLDNVIKAVEDAGKRSGQKVSPEALAKAVKGFLPYMAQDEKMRYQEMLMGFRERAASDRERALFDAEMRNRDLQDYRKQNLILRGEHELRMIDKDKFQRDEAMVRAKERAEAAALKAKEYEDKKMDREAKAQRDIVKLQLQIMHTRALELIGASGLDDETMQEVIKQNNQEFGNLLNSPALQPGAGTAGTSTPGQPGAAPRVWDPKTGKFTPPAPVQ